MARGQQITIEVFVVDVSTRLGIAGDTANLHLFLVRDGVIDTSELTPSEVNATYRQGVYEVTLTAEQHGASYTNFMVAGYSDTANTIVIPTEISYAQIGTGFVAHYFAVNLGTNTMEPGDAANHTLYFQQDDGSSSAAGPTTEIDSVRVPGCYRVTFTNANAACSVLSFGGTSSTADVQIVNRQYILSIPLPSIDDVIEGVDRGDGQTGTYHETLTSEVLSGVAFGPNSSYEGTYTPTYAATSDVRSGVDRGDTNLGTLVVPSASDVKLGVVFDNGTTGTYAASTAVITGVSSPVLVGGSITITGTGFGSNTGESTVAVGGHCCEITSWTDTEIVAILNSNIAAGTYDVAVITSEPACTIEPDILVIQNESDTGDTTYIATTGPDGKENSAFVVSDGTYKSLGDVVLNNGTLVVWSTHTPEISIGGSSITFTEFDNDGTWYMYYATGISYSGALRVSATGSDKSYADIRGYNSTLSNGTLTYLYNDMIQNSGDSTLPWF